MHNGPAFAGLATGKLLARRVLLTEGMLAPHVTQSPTELVYDRRSSPRVSLEAPALIDALHAWRKCVVKSVSASGLCVQTDWALKVGTQVDLYFEIPRVIAVETRGEVVRRGDGELAFRFLDLPESAELTLETYVRSHVDDTLPERVVVC